jgi:hypothetical protein
MKIEVLGIGMEESPSQPMRCLVVDDVLAIDAGSLFRVLPAARREALAWLLLTDASWQAARDVDAWNQAGLGRVISCSKEKSGTFSLSPKGNRLAQSTRAAEPAAKARTATKVTWQHSDSMRSANVIVDVQGVKVLFWSLGARAKVIPAFDADWLITCHDERTLALYRVVESARGARRGAKKVSAKREGLLRIGDVLELA